MQVLFSVGNTVKYKLGNGIKQQLLWRPGDWVAVGSNLEYKWWSLDLGCNGSKERGRDGLFWTQGKLLHLLEPNKVCYSSHLAEYISQLNRQHFCLFAAMCNLTFFYPHLLDARTKEPS